MIFYSVTVLLQRTFLKDDKSNPIAYAVIVQLVVAVISLIFAAESSLVFPDIPSQVSINVLLMVFVYTFSSILTFKTVKMVEASEYTILIFTRAFWSVAVAIIFLSEPFTPVKIAGTALIFLSVVMVSWKGKGIRFGKGEALGLSAAFLLGIGFVNDAIVLENLGFWPFMGLAWATAFGNSTNYP
jgi:drug/metabolite transporter (DMT)-like permease